jgi:hypothetical protein
MLQPGDHLDPAKTLKSLTRTQREAITAIAFFRRQRKPAEVGW